MTRIYRPLALALVPSLVLVLPGCASVGPAGRPAAARTCFHASEAAENDIGYCQALRVGNTLHVSGTAGQGDMQAAMRSVYDRLRATLAAHGLGFADVVRENVYATDLDAFIRNKDVRKAYYGQSFPAASWVQVQRLYVPSLVVEVELEAVYPRQ